MTTPFEYPNVTCRRFLTEETREGLEVLDVGCGYGELMEALASSGCVMKGVEIDEKLVELAVAKGLDVRQGVAENLPFPDASFDAVVCSVVLPYTDQDRTIAEWARVLRPGGFIRATYHGMSYPLYMMRPGTSFKYRVYAMRILTNTLLYRITGLKLPGVMSDTLCQYPKSLRKSYAKSGLTLACELIVRPILGLPTMICHRVVHSGPVA